MAVTLQGDQPYWFDMHPQPFLMHFVLRVSVTDGLGGVEAVEPTAHCPEAVTLVQSCLASSRPSILFDTYPRPVQEKSY